MCDMNCTAVALGTYQRKAEINIVYQEPICTRCVLLLSKFLNKSIEAQNQRNYEVKANITPLCLCFHICNSIRLRSMLLLL